MASTSPVWSESGSKVWSMIASKTELSEETFEFGVPEESRGRSRPTVVRLTALFGVREASTGTVAAKEGRLTALFGVREAAA